MKRIKTIALVLCTALLCFAATAMAGEFSFYDSVNEWIVIAYTVDNGPTAGTYSVYLNIRGKEDTPVDPALILLSRGGVRQDPTPNGDYLICDCAVSDQISLAYQSAGGLSEIFVMDHHLDAQLQDFVKVHNTIQLSGFDVQEPANISVSGSGSFGTVNVGSSSTSYITVSNTGEADLTLSSIDVTGESFEREGGTCGATVAGGGSCTIGVKFEPAAATSYQGNLAIQSNDGEQPTVNVSLSGTGFQQTGTADLIVSMVTHLGTIGGGADLAITVTVKNQGNGASGPFVVRGTKGTSTEMYTWNVPSLAAGQTLVNTLNYTFQCAAHSGFYLYHTADANQQVTESNESNNMRWSYVYCNR